MGVGEHVAFSGWVSISSFLAPLHAQLLPLSYAHFTFTLCFGSPHSLLLDCFLPVLANSIHPPRSSFIKLSLHVQLGVTPPLTLHPPSLSKPVSLPSPGRRLFQFPCWTVSSFRTRPCAAHLCVLCTTLLYLKYSQQTFRRQLNKCVAQQIYLESLDVTFSGVGDPRQGPCVE